MLSPFRFGVPAQDADPEDADAYEVMPVGAGRVKWIAGPVNWKCMCCPPSVEQAQAVRLRLSRQ